MKSLLAALVLIVSVTAGARSMEMPHDLRAIEAFNNSEGVKSMMQLVSKDKLFNTEGETKAVLLNGQCGFAGCGEVYLVSKVLQRRGVNSSTDSVSAIVTLPAMGGAKVSPAFGSDYLLQSIKM